MGGCAHKKRISKAQQAELEAAERQRVQDSIAELEAFRLQQIELQRVLDSIAAAEEAKKAQVQSMYISRMTITIRMQGQQLATPATLRWRRDEGVIAGIQPFAGLEMLRIEFNDDGLKIIDKINMRYSLLTPDQLAQMGVPATQEAVDAWIDERILARLDEPQLTLEISRDGISGTAVIQTSGIQTGGNIALKPINVNAYRQVTLEQLTSGL